MYRVRPLQKLCERRMAEGGVGVASQLFDTNFIGLAGGGDKPAFPVNKFVLWDDYTGEAGKSVSERIEKDRIVGIKMNNDVIAIVMARSIVVYKLQNMQLLRKIKTAPNPNGVCALSSYKEKILICPGREVGTVLVVDYAADTERTVKCHTSAIQTITINTTTDDPNFADPNADTMFATTSEQGTLIRVFDMSTHEKLHELRRGSDSCRIYDVHFSTDSKCLAVTSNKGTVHVYSLNESFSNVSSRAGLLAGVSSYFGSKWSPFSINFQGAQQSRTEVGGKDFQQAPTSEVPYHTACLVPYDVMSSSSKKENDTYRLTIVCLDGSYAIHDLQFKNAKSIPQSSGMLEDLPRPKSYAEAADNSNADEE